MASHACAAQVLVIDVNSTNGTMVNGTEIKAMDYVEVPIGGEIVFGKQAAGSSQVRRTSVHFASG
jgi:pSer/pThr/pTyr-binding forkhead associated (FHA) protein